MRAGIYRGRDTMRLEEVPVPVPGPDEVRVKVEACGVCGSDLHVYRSDSRQEMLGMTLGHELVGTVDDAGSSATFRVGDRVTVEPLLSCGECAPCLSGRSTGCAQFGLIGMQQPGGFADYVVAPDRRLFHVPDDLEPAIAALAEPVAVCVRGIDRGRMEPGEHVLVLGGGTIGLLTVAVARLRGAGKISITARYPHQAEAAVALGTDEVLDPETVTSQHMADSLRESPPTLVVETVGGGAPTVQAGYAAAAPGGRVVVLGVFFEPMTVEPLVLLRKEVSLIWSLCYVRRADGGSDFAEAIGMISKHSELFARILTHRRSLDEVADAFALSDDKSRETIKVTVFP